MSESIGVVLFFVIIAAWLTHVITCFGIGAWGFLIAGRCSFPLGLSTAFIFGSEGATWTAK